MGFCRQEKNKLGLVAPTTIMALTQVANWLFDKNMTDLIRYNTNPSTMKRIKQLILPHKEDVRNIANHNVSMFDKRKVSQKASLL